MIHRVIKFVAMLAGRAPTAEVIALGRWENEGGANPPLALASLIVASSEPQQGTLSPAVSAALDARQDRIMKIVSTDGRPPSAAQRMLEWRWVGLGAVLVSIALAAWLIFGRVTLSGVGAGLAIGVLMLVGASPVLAAGLLRGKEERAARRIARMERRQGRQP